MKTLMTILALICFNLNTAEAGLFRCLTLSTVDLTQTQTVSLNGEVHADLTVQHKTLLCDDKVKEAISVAVDLRSLVGSRLPNGGFLTSKVQAFDKAGKKIHEKLLKGAVSVTHDYPFSSEAKSVLVDVEGFAQTKISL